MIQVERRKKQRSKTTSKLHLGLVLVILLQSVAVIILYERSASETKIHISGGNATNTIQDEEVTPGPAANTNGRGHNDNESPGGLILSAAFGYMQDPRETNRRNPRPHILPTFENIYHFVSLSNSVCLGRK